MGPKLSFWKLNFSLLIVKFKKLRFSAPLISRQKVALLNPTFYSLEEYVQLFCREHNFACLFILLAKKIKSFVTYTIYN